MLGFLSNSHFANRLADSETNVNHYISHFDAICGDPFLLVNKVLLVHIGSNSDKKQRGFSAFRFPGWSIIRKPMTPEKSPRKKITKSPLLKTRDLALSDFFGAEGPLAKQFPGYEMRPEQLAVADTVERAMASGKICLAEAGTGVGKSLAYLVPAVRAALEGRRTIISTHTIGLQSQLMEKDIPLVLSLFADEPEEKLAAISPQVMKGRGNFLCKQELDFAKDDLFLAADPNFHRLRKWAWEDDCSGDLADLPFAYPNWYDLVSTPDTCRGQECRHYASCFYYRMRFEAQESCLLIVNHALFFSDLALRLTDPSSGVIPAYDHVVFDEAHHLEDVATKTFGIEFGSRRIENLMDRIKHVKELDVDKDRLSTLEGLGASLFAPFVALGKQEFYFEEAIPQDRRSEVEGQTNITCNSISELQKSLLEQAKDDENLKERVEGLSRLCGRMREELQQLFFQEDENAIRWGDVTMVGRTNKQEPRVTLRLTPVSVAKILRKALWERQDAKKGSSVTLVSATLSNSGGFSYLKERLGVPEKNTLECVVGSPFDYKKQCLLYVPADLPAPPKVHSDSYIAQVSLQIERLLKLTQGRAFVLFTSRRMLNSIHEKLSGSLPYPVFKQGDLPPGKLVQEFKASQNGVLFGTQTFWEGVDVQGDSLSCVIIDRIPFAVPDSPVTKARTKAIDLNGGNWFRDFSIPQAQIKLKQGFGRLIRTHTDRGIVCILDTRLIHSDYGKEFVAHLPPAARASKWSRVEKFWKDEA